MCDDEGGGVGGGGGACVCVCGGCCYLIRVQTDSSTCRCNKAEGAE